MMARFNDHVQNFRYATAPVVRSLDTAAAKQKPLLFGASLTTVLNTFDESKAALDRDPLLSHEAKSEMQTNLRNAATDSINVLGNDFLKSIDSELSTLKQRSAPTDAAAAETRALRAEQRLGRLLDRRMPAMDVIENSDAAMLDSLQANPGVYASGLDSDTLATLVQVRRRAIATPQEAASLDQIDYLGGLKRRVETMTGMGVLEVSTGESWGVRDPRSWELTPPNRD
jgi:hypothetical protein